MIKHKEGCHATTRLLLSNPPQPAPCNCGAVETVGGMKFDSGKLDYTLIPWDGLEEVVKVLEFGAKKYARENWRKVEFAETRYMAAAFRHMVAYQMNEEVDPETGLSHLAHATCCLLFLLALEKRNGSNT